MLSVAAPHFLGSQTLAPSGDSCEWWGGIPAYVPGQAGSAGGSHFQSAWVSSEPVDCCSIWGLQGREAYFPTTTLLLKLLTQATGRCPHVASQSSPLLLAPGLEEDCVVVVSSDWGCKARLTKWPRQRTPRKSDSASLFSLCEGLSSVPYQNRGLGKMQEITGFHLKNE